MIKLKEKYKREEWTFALSVLNPYENDSGKAGHCLLHIAFFKRSYWFIIPEIFKPKAKWVDTSKYEWATERDGRKGYTEYMQRQYGITINPETILIYYGIQPGCYINNDPENSDHCKVFWWPWYPTIIRHDLLFPDGSLFLRNKYPRKKGQKTYNWYDVLSTADDQFDRDTSKTVKLKHYDKYTGKLQEANVKLRGELREWRPKWTRWLPIFRRISRVVWCDSDTELGKRAGSWKGGMTGWSADWREGELLEDAFWRWYKNWDGN